MGERSRDDNKPSQANNNNNNPPQSDDHDANGPVCDLNNAPRRNSTTGGDQPSKNDNQNNPTQSDKRTMGDERSRDNVDNTTGSSKTQTTGEQSRGNDSKSNASSAGKTIGERSRDDDRNPTDSSHGKTMGERSRDSDSNPSASSRDNKSGEQSKDNEDNPKGLSKDKTCHTTEEKGSKNDGDNHNNPTNRSPEHGNSSSASQARVDDGNNRNKPPKQTMEEDNRQVTPPELNAPPSDEKAKGRDKDTSSSMGRDNAAKSVRTKGKDNDDNKTANVPSTGNRKTEQLSADSDNSRNSPPSSNKTTEGNNNQLASDASPPHKSNEDSNTSVAQDNAAMSQNINNENKPTPSNKTKDDNNPPAPNASPPQEESTDEYPVCIIGNERNNQNKQSSGKKTTPKERSNENRQSSSNKETPHELNNENMQSSSNKTTPQEHNNNNKKKQSSRNKTKDDDNKQRGSNVSHTRKRTPGELPQDDDNQMCMLDEGSPTDKSSRDSNVTQSYNKKGDDDDNQMCVLENVPQSGNKPMGDDGKCSSASLPPPAERSNSSTIHVQPPRKSGQQLVDDENESPIAIYNAPSPHSKSQSYTHQLRTNTGTNIKRHRPKLHHKHSLDDTSVSNNIGGVSDSEEDEYYAYEGGDSAVAGATVMCGEYAAADGQSLPEFYGNDSNAPEIFKAPRRAAVHPNRPPFLELRPHPLRETQVGKFLRTIASTDTQLWAGQESGVRVWRLSDAYEPGIGVGGRARRGDEDAAPFYESVSTSPTMCLAIDCGTRLVWSGHKDGKIRSWSMDETLDDNPFLEGLSWQAHRGAVLSLVISSCGDLWSGSEGGNIHVWSWEAIDKSLSLKVEERHMASLLVERSFINLRSQVTVNGCCNISSQDVKVLCSDKVVGKVWASGSSSFSLWDARTRELLKVYNVEGHIENRADMPQVQDQGVEDEMSVKLVSKSKKEKSGFLQRSRNAIMGAAGAVRRAATKSGGDESKKTEAVVVAPNGMIYSGCTNGLIVQWDGNGNRLQEFNHHPCAVLCFCTYGSRIWVGYVSGMLQVLDLDGNLIAGWIAHNGPVIKLVVGNGQVFSLATHGGIRGWNIAAPGPIDQVVRPELSKKEKSYTRRENIKILVGTWNVGQGKSSHNALMTWVGSAASDAGIFVVGLQEVEMGAGFLAMSAAKETVGLEGSSIGHWWQDAIGKALNEGSTFERVGSRQLAGLLIAIWVRTSIRTYVGDLDTGAVACGLGRTFGNKGGVGLRLRVYDRIMCFVNCHFAAHLEAVNRRNADFNHIYRTMTFSRSSNLLSNASAGVSSAAQGLRGTNTVENNPGKGKPDLAEADLVIFCGDFNYRLFGISYDDARDLVSQRSFDWLRERDQLRAEMKAGKVFHGMREAIIRFPPTYKFERGKAGLGGYDSGEKKRIPAWCDRILYRDNRSSSTLECNLECPVLASVLQYEACMDVVESDHKPVRCKLNIEIANVDRSVRRQELGKIINSHEAIRSLRSELCFVPKTDVSTSRIVLQSHDACSLKITNNCATDKAIFHIKCEGQATIQEDEQELVFSPRGAFGFPRWLEVIPASGVIGPDQVADISVRHEEFQTTEQFGDAVPQSWWSEDTCDKEVLLSVIVRGNCSTETKSHQVRVRHCYSCKATRTDSSKSGSGSRKYQGYTKQRSGSKHGGNQSDDESRSSHGSEKDLQHKTG